MGVTTSDAARLVDADRHPVHLHRDDVPLTLSLLELVVGHGGPAGWEPTEHGAFVEWDELAGSHLSSTERAAVQIARGCATLERQGGLPPRLRAAVVATVQGVA